MDLIACLDICPNPSPVPPQNSRERSWEQGCMIFKSFSLEIIYVMFPVTSERKQFHNFSLKISWHVCFVIHRGFLSIGFVFYFCRQGQHQKEAHAWEEYTVARRSPSLYMLDLCEQRPLTNCQQFKILASVHFFLDKSNKRNKIDVQTDSLSHWNSHAPVSRKWLHFLKKHSSENKGNVDHDWDHNQTFSPMTCFLSIWFFYYGIEHLYTVIMRIGCLTSSRVIWLSACTARGWCCVNLGLSLFFYLS